VTADQSWKHQAFGSPGEFPGAPEDPAAPFLDVWAKIGVRLEGLTAELRAQRIREAAEYEDISYRPLQPLQFLGSAAPAVLPVFCPLGWRWAVQAVVCNGLAGTDSMTVYRGAAPSSAQPQNQLGILTPAAPMLHRGRTGLLLDAQQSLVFGGTLTGGSLYTINVDVISVSDRALCRFLI
jgi:hypothetical protein